MKKKKHNTTRRRKHIHQSKIMYPTTTQNIHKKLKPGLVAFYDIRPGNGAGLFSKEKISMKEDKKVKKKGYAGKHTI